MAALPLFTIKSTAAQRLTLLLLNEVRDLLLMAYVILIDSSSFTRPCDVN